MSVFGGLVHGGIVEQAVGDTLKLWFPTYLREVERQHDRDQLALPAPRSYQLVSESDDPTRWLEDQLPSIIVMCPGFAEQPRHAGSGAYDARYSVSVAAIVSANTQGATRQLARLYGAAIAAILVQKPSLGGVANGLQWADESYDDIPADSARSLACVIEGFIVDMPAVLDSQAGPLVPDEEANEEGPEWPQVQTTDVELQPFQED